MTQTAVHTTPFAASGARRRVIAAARLTLELALAALIAVLAARALWFGVYGASAFSLDVEAASARPALRSGGAADLSRLASAGLFSARSFEGQSADPAIIDAPETRLDLILHGVRRSADPDRSTAVIQAPRQGQRSLGVGAEIVDGVTLEAVYADRVIINRRGARESLFLREEAETGARLIRSAGAPEPAPAPPADAESPAQAEAEALGAQDIAAGLRLALERDGERILGYRVSEQSRSDVLSAIGLQAGDLVTTLNGRALDRPAKILDLLEQLERAEQVRLTVLRDGEALSLEAELR
jgi:general secretion pathway protein C